MANENKKFKVNLKANRKKELTFFEKKGLNWTINWLRNRLKGYDVYFPIDKKSDEDPEEFVVNTLVDLGADHPASLLISKAICQLLLESLSKSPEIPEYFDDLIRICQEVRVPHTSDWFQEELLRLKADSKKAEDFWGGFERIKEILFAAIEQANSKMGRESKKIWLDLLKLRKYSSYALLGLGRSLSEQAEYLEIWWTARPENRAEKLNSMIRLAVKTGEIDLSKSVFEKRRNYLPNDLKEAIDSSLADNKISPVFRSYIRQEPTFVFSKTYESESSTSFVKFIPDIEEEEIKSHGRHVDFDAVAEKLLR